MKSLFRANPLSILSGRSIGERLPRESVFDMLNNQRRRYAFHYLQQANGPVDVSDLCDHVAAWENGTEPHLVPSQARQRVYVSLIQTHLPKLNLADVVEFDETSGSVELADNASSMKVYLETVPEGDILWAHYYLGVTAIAAAFAGMVWWGIEPFADYPLAVWIAIAVTFLVSAALHHRYLGARRLGVEGPPPSEL